MKRQIFIDSDLQRKFEKEGYVVVPLLNNNQIADCKDLFHKYTSGVELNFYTSIWSEDKAYRKKVDQGLKKLLVEPLESYLDDCRPVFANYMVKRPGRQSSLDLHQDWTFVDEEEYDSVTVWVPLVDTTPLNGSLKLVLGSHKFDIPIRGRGIKSPFDEVKQFIKDHYLTNVNNNAGDAVIFNSRMFHCSYDNLSGKDRIAISVVMVPKEAPLIHYIKQNQQEHEKVERLFVDEEFYTNFGLEDDLKSIENRQHADYKEWDLSMETFDHHYNSFNGK